MPKAKSPPTRFDLKVKTAKKILSLLSTYRQGEVTFILDCVDEELEDKRQSKVAKAPDQDFPQPAHA